MLCTLSIHTFLGKSIVYINNWICKYQGRIITKVYKAENPEYIMLGFEGDTSDQEFEIIHMEEIEVYER